MKTIANSTLCVAGGLHQPGRVHAQPQFGDRPDARSVRAVRPHEQVPKATIPHRADLPPAADARHVPAAGDRRRRAFSGRRRRPVPPTADLRLRRDDGAGARDVAALPAAVRRLQAPQPQEQQGGSAQTARLPRPQLGRRPLPPGPHEEQRRVQPPAGPGRCPRGHVRQIRQLQRRRSWRSGMLILIFSGTYIFKHPMEYFFLCNLIIFFNLRFY